MHNSTRARSVLKASALMAAGGVLLGGVALADLWFDDGRALYAAFGRDALARSCTAPLIRRLAEQGFEPADVEFGPRPRVSLAWGHERSFGDSFTFTDGAAQERVDGVLACEVSGGTVTIELRVGAVPHRAA